MLVQDVEKFVGAVKRATWLSWWAQVILRSDLLVSLSLFFMPTCVHV